MAKSDLMLIAQDIKSQCGSSGIYDKYNKAVELHKMGIDRAAFNYLRKVGKTNQYTLPAKPRFLDRLGPRLRYLTARESRREILYSLSLVDKTSQAEKEEQRIKFILEQLELLCREHLGDIDEEIQGLNETIASIDEQISMGNQQISVMEQQRSNGQNVPQEKIIEAKQALEYVQKQSDRIKIRIKHRMDFLNNKKIFTSQNLQEISERANTSLKDIKEEKVQCLLETMVFNMNLEEQKKYAFKQSLICGIGAEYYYVDLEPGNDNPCFEAIHPRDVYYPQTSNTWVQDGDWVLFRKRMTTEQIIRRFKPKDEVIARLRSRDSFYSQSMKTNVNGGARFDEGNPGSNVYHEVNFIFWMSEVNVVWSFFENKYDASKPHVHLTENPSSKPKKKESRETTYLTHVYQAVMFDDVFLLEPEIKPEVVRSADNISVPKLPVIGLVFDEDTRKPYSLVLETKDAMELSIVINFKMELIIALSGVKGFIMDDSQRPSNMGRDEWAYLRKTGTAYIESMKKGGRPANFNQFQTYDDTLPQSIEVLLTFDESIEKHYDIATGVTRQSLAQIEQYDLKGTTEAATKQTMMITEIFFETHERVYCKALEQLINLKAKFCNEKEIVSSYYHPEYGYKSVSFGSGVISERDISIVVQDSGKDERLVQTMQGIAMGYFKEGSIPFNVLASILNSNSFKKIENKIAYYLKDFQDKMLQAKQNENDAKFQNEKEKIQMQGEVQKLIKEIDVQIQNAKLEIENKRLAMDQGRNEWEMGFKERELQSKTALGKYQADSERAVETSYLGEQKRQAMVNEQFKALELNLQRLLGILSESNYHDIETKKISTIKSKEKIKD